MIDVDHQINAVHRTVGKRTLQAGEARTLTISQAYDTDVEDLWDACTNIERLPRWFLPVTGDLRVGGRYQFEGNAGGAVESCDPPKSFTATWEYGGEVSWIEVTLSADPDGKARFTMEHIAHVSDENWKMFGPGMVGIGWDLSLLGLAQHLESGGDNTLTPEAAPAWLLSAEGKRFMTISSEQWAEANIAAGEPEESARAAAQGVTAAYTADPEESPNT
jgi:uncharacterized protein YndB with AHSA1/START domain